MRSIQQRIDELETKAKSSVDITVNILTLPDGCQGMLEFDDNYKTAFIKISEEYNNKITQDGDDFYKDTLLHELIHLDDTINYMNFLKLPLSNYDFLDTSKEFALRCCWSEFHAIINCYPYIYNRCISPTITDSIKEAQILAITNEIVIKKNENWSATIYNFTRYLAEFATTDCLKQFDNINFDTHMDKNFLSKFGDKIYEYNDLLNQMLDFDTAKHKLDKLVILISALENSYTNSHK